MSELLKRVAEVFNAEEDKLVKLASVVNQPEWISLTKRRDELLKLRATVLDLIREDLKNED